MQYTQVLLLGIAFACAISCIAADEYKVVETKNGKVRGVEKTTLLKNIKYYSFKGIPYAKPPVGDLRFKAPEPVESWTPTVLDALEHGKVCIPLGLFEPVPLPSSEDCLTLNIYVPANVNPNEKLAVLFFIHGGAFFDGSSDDGIYGPDFIVEKQTILVSFNYRLGVLGFLSLDTPEYSGNMGLKDQQLALKWISENIERFGGDNQRITVFGHSAGGASTHYQVLSAESRKYFRNAIPMSGVTENWWALSNLDHLKHAFSIAEQLGEPKENKEQLIAFLKEVPANKFGQFAPIQTKDNVLFEIPLGPIVERKDAKRPFLLKSPEEVLKTSKIDVDTMFSLTSVEMISLFENPDKNILQYLDATFSAPIPFRGLDIPSDSEAGRQITQSVRKFYFGDEPISEKTLPNLYDFLSDLNFVIGTDQSIKLHSKYSKGKTYFTWITIESALNAMKLLEVFKSNVHPKLPGTAHGDELCYLFRCGVAQELYDNVLANENEQQSQLSLQTIEYLTTLFTNFAKYGEPTYKNSPIKGFKPIHKNEIKVLHVTNDGLKVDSQPRKDAINFWEDIKQQAIKISRSDKAQQREEL